MKKNDKNYYSKDDLHRMERQRRKRGLSYDDIAEAAEVSEQTVRSMLGGKHVPRADVEKRVLKALGITKQLTYETS